MLAVSIEILSQQSGNSIVDMPYMCPTVSSSPPHQVLPVLPNGVILITVKLEKLEIVIELSSKSNG